MSEEPLQQALERISNLENQVRRNRHNNRALFWLIATLISFSMPFLLLESEFTFSPEGIRGGVRSRSLELPREAKLLIVLCGASGLGIIGKEPLERLLANVLGKTERHDETPS